jgi:hypothetical protein
MSSVFLNNEISSPPLDWVLRSNVVFFQAASIYEISYSFLASLEDSIQISLTSSGISYRLSSRTCDNEIVLTLSSKVQLALAISLTQCLSLIYEPLSY